MVHNILFNFFIQYIIFYHILFHSPTPPRSLFPLFYFSLSERKGTHKTNKKGVKTNKKIPQETSKTNIK